MDLKGTAFVIIDSARIHVEDEKFAKGEITVDGTRVITPDGPSSATDRHPLANL